MAATPALYGHFLHVAWLRWSVKGAQWQAEILVATSVVFLTLRHDCCWTFTWLLARICLCKVPDNFLKRYLLCIFLSFHGTKPARSPCLCASVPSFRADVAILLLSFSSAPSSSKQAGDAVVIFCSKDTSNSLQRKAQ